MTARSKNNASTKRLRRRKGTSHSNTPYISFGVKSTMCLGIFVIVYAIFMMCFQPMLRDEEKAKKLRNAKDRLIKKKHELVGHVRSEGEAWKKEFKDLKKFRGNAHLEVEEQLIDKAWQQLHKNKKHNVSERDTNMKKKQSKEVLDESIDSKNVSVKSNSEKPTTGFMVLGMHRSGTSMLSGLLVEGFGYNVGEPLIGAAFDNEKGFFELIPAVLQNDAWMYNQNVNWSASVRNYDVDHALKATKNHEVNTNQLDKALKVLNDPDNIPWLQKDPRMCITMKTWLPYLNSKPAIIFTYRHPLEVAMSLNKREEGFTVLRGLRLWILYNKAAIQNSAGLCRVFSSNTAVLEDPLGETKRIAKILEDKCNVPKPPKTVTQQAVDAFVDTTLQHKKPQNMNVLKSYGDCEIHDYDKVDGTQKDAQEQNMYLKAMKVYCDLQSGEAYKNEYDWPQFQ